MHFLDKTISVNGTEKEFFQKVIEELTAADDRITCDTDLEDEFADDSKTPKINFNLLGACNLSFTRKNSLQSSNNYYTVKISYNNDETSAEIVPASSTSISYQAIADRQLPLRLIPENGGLVLYIFTDNAMSFLGIGVGVLKNEDFTAVATTTSNNILDCEFIRTDETSNGKTYKAINRLEYSTENENNLDIIRGKALTTGDKKSIEFDGLLDCSYIPIRSTVTINGKNYYSLNNYTLIEKNS